MKDFTMYIFETLTGMCISGSVIGFTFSAMIYFLGMMPGLFRTLVK